MRWGGEKEIGCLAYSYVINIHELQPSRSVLLPLLCTSSVRFFARFPTVSAQFFAKAKFYRVDELACILKARNEVVMNTNRVRKIEVIFGHNRCSPRCVAIR